MKKTELEIFDYIFKLVRKTLRTQTVSQKLDKIEVYVEDFTGFYTYWETGNGFTHYEVMVPYRKARLSFLTRLSLRHEAGHIIFNELYKYNTADLKIELNRMRKTYFGIFRFFQTFWYWNPVIRKIKKLFGYSGKIEYKKDDPYDDDDIFTHGDNEFFCDHFALFGRKSDD